MQAYKENPAAPNYQGSEYFLGRRGRTKDGAMVAPEMKTHVSGKVRRDAAILKEKRKAKEELSLARKPGKDGRAGR